MRQKYEAGSTYLGLLIAYALRCVRQTMEGRIAVSDNLLIRGTGLLRNARSAGRGLAFVIPGQGYKEVKE